MLHWGRHKKRLEDSEAVGEALRDVLLAMLRDLLLVPEAVVAVGDDRADETTDSGRGAASLGSTTTTRLPGDPPEPPLAEDGEGNSSSCSSESPVFNFLDVMTLH